MGQSVALKLQSLLDVLYLEHILDTFGHFTDIIRIGTAKGKGRPGPDLKHVLDTFGYFTDIIRIGT